MFLPPYVPLADPELAIEELEILLEQGAPVIQIKAGHAHGGRDNPWGGRSPADPVYDPIWSRVNEAGVQLAVHQGGTDYQKYGADWSENPQDTLGTFDAFQYIMYWSTARRWSSSPVSCCTTSSHASRTSAWYGRARIGLGAVHRPQDGSRVPDGPEGEVGQARPSARARSSGATSSSPRTRGERRRVIAAVGIDPVVFGSDFPHGEGLAFPPSTRRRQLAGMSDADVKRIMRANLAGYLGIAA